MDATPPSCFCPASPRSRRHHRKGRARCQSILQDNRPASDLKAPPQPPAGRKVFSENLCSPPELLPPRSRRRRSNETVRSRKVCPGRLRRSDIPSLCAENPTCRQTWRWDLLDRLRRQCIQSKDSILSELASTFC